MHSIHIHILWHWVSYQNTDCTLLSLNALWHVSVITLYYGSEHTSTRLPLEIKPTTLGTTEAMSPMP